MGAFFFRSRSAMVFYTYQGIRFRGSKFYYNPFHKIKDRFGDLEQKVACGFFNRSTFLKAANGQRPGNWFYDDGRKFPSIIFGEDVIQDHWNKRFPNKNAHVFSFISRDRVFYHHPRDLWIEKQVGLMKKHRVGYGEGFRLMEREYQKQLYVSQLERQHQLQQVAELGGCTELNDRTWLDHWMVQEATLRSRDANEMKQRWLKTRLYDMLHEMIDDQIPEIESKRISIVDFHPSMLDQEAVREFILENPELSRHFDVSWFLLDKSRLVTARINRIWNRAWCPTILTSSLVSCGKKRPVRHVARTRNLPICWHPQETRMHRNGTVLAPTENKRPRILSPNWWPIWTNKSKPKTNCKQPRHAVLLPFVNS